jgi:tetratricopeptide (TPR) repeat protein
MHGIHSTLIRSALLLALAQLAQAQPTAQQAAPGASGPVRQVSAQQVEQKAGMLQRVLNQSPVAARIANSQNEQARRHFSNARELTMHAKELAAEGQLRAADSLLNEAIFEVSKAQQLVPDPGTQQAGERARFSQLEDSVAALRRAAQIALPNPGAKQAETEQVLRTADGLVDQALALAKSDKYIEANRQLDRALMLLLKDASTRLAGQTIVYDHRFANRREEFDFELDRHRSFERLVPLALLEFRPSPEARALVDRQVAQARELRERGESQFGRDPIAAIKDVTDGTEALRRALQAAGLAVPQTMSTPP